MVNGDPKHQPPRGLRRERTRCEPVPVCTGHYWELGDSDPEHQPQRGPGLKSLVCKRLVPEGTGEMRELVDGASSNSPRGD